MSSTNSDLDLSPLLRQCINGMLDCFHGHGALPWRIPAEGRLAGTLEVSRSTVRSALDYLRETGVISGEGRQTCLAQRIYKKDYLELPEQALSRAEEFEQFFLKKISLSELKPGQYFSERELSLEADVNTVQVREVLARFARMGFIEKEPRHRWRMVQFDKQMIDELFDMREMIEERAIKTVSSKPISDQLRRVLQKLLKEHQVLRKRRSRTVQDFWELDDRFHKIFLEEAGNRYMLDLFSSISLLIHFQLQHDATGQYGMNAGIEQHIVVLEALLKGNKQAARKGMLEHINTARRVMKVTAGVEGEVLQ